MKADISPTRRLYKQHLFILAYLFLVTLFLTGCFGTKQSDAQVQSDFDDFTNQIFVSEIQKDGITFNYTLAHPKEYGITLAPDTLGDYSLTAMEQSANVVEDYLSELKSFSYKQLTDEQKLTYDVLKDYLTTALGSADYLLYQSCLSKTTGLQAQLPVLFAEYNFSDKDSVDTYLLLLSDIERYFQQIIDFERLKIQYALFMSHDTAEDIIAQCQNFIEKKEDNLLIQVFNDKIETVDGLSKTEIKAYKKENKQIVLTSVLPAYQNLISFLTEEIDSGVNSGGLCNFPQGKEYYQYLVSASTGSSKTIKEIDKALDSTLKTAILTMQQLMKEDVTILEKAEAVSYPIKEPAAILSYLETAIQENYPSLDTVDYSIKYVHESLQPDLSPAFYLTPPIDDEGQNSIYINPYRSLDMDTIFTTLAHEGYPGHLYQNVFFHRTNPSPVRSIVGYSGYSEGWATYVEMDSYYLAGIGDALAEFLRANNLASLCMYGKIDVGVNYYGWDLEETKDYLLTFGIEDSEACEEIYRAMVAEPGNYLNYIVGCIEFLELREAAAKKLKDDFVLKDFHEAILSIGPTSFDVLRNYLKY